MHLVQVTAIRRPGATRDQLRIAAHDHLGGRVTRLCPRCGSTAHGRPRMRGAHLSLSYTEGLVLVARSDVPVGVDVQPGEPDWARTEAILKCTGDGLGGTPDETGLHLQRLPIRHGWMATRGPAALSWSTSWAEGGAPRR